MQIIYHIAFPDKLILCQNMVNLLLIHLSAKEQLNTIQLCMREM